MEPLLFCLRVHPCTPIQVMVFCIRSKQFELCFDNSEPPNHEYEKTHMKVSDSVCTGLYCPSQPPRMQELLLFS